MSSTKQANADSSSQSNEEVKPENAEHVPQIDSQKYKTPTNTNEIYKAQSGAPKQKRRKKKHRSIPKIEPSDIAWEFETPTSIMKKKKRITKLENPNDKEKKTEPVSIEDIEDIKL